MSAKSARRHSRRDREPLTVKSEIIHVKRDCLQIFFLLVLPRLKGK